MRRHPPRDPYFILGVDRHASAAEIKAAYRRLALIHHPDRNPENPAAEEKFKELSQAYAILGDEENRAQFDRFGATPSTLPFGSDGDLEKVTDFFNQVFGDLFGTKRTSKGSQDLRYTLELDFEEAALGCEKEIRFQRQEDCKDCHGTGAQGGQAGLLRCATCQGDGHLRQGSGLFATRHPCPNCDGRGHIPKTPCRLCQGQGLRENERVFTVRIPAGSQQGATQRVAGEGSPGHAGGPPGDLSVHIRVRPHPFYRQQGDLLICELPLSPTDAALGTDTDVPLLDTVVRMKIPAGTQTGGVFRVRGKGLPRPNGVRGDVHIVVNIETPVNLTTPSRTLWEAAGRALGDEQLPRRHTFRQTTEQIRKKAST